jgi:hypothetical protein
MTIAASFVIVFALLQGPAGPADRSEDPGHTSGHMVPQPPPVFGIPTRSGQLCPLSFCDDFADVCESSGASEFACNLNAKLCESAPCQACDDAIASCNKLGGKHCDEIASKCRGQLTDCCIVTEAPECTSTDSIGSYLPTYCEVKPLGRPVTCPKGHASASVCQKALEASEGADLTTCDYAACQAALLEAPCDLIPDACLPFEGFVE